MVDNKTEKPTQLKSQAPSSSSPKDPAPEQELQAQTRHQAYISSPSAYVPISPPSSSPFDPSVNPKRPRYGAAPAKASAPPHQQWKRLPSSAPSPSEHQKQTQIAIDTSESAIPISSFSPLPNPAGASSSETPGSSPAHSGQDQPVTATTQKSEHFRKGKYVSPLWKPNEMLWLARAWRVQYQGSGSRSDPNHEAGQPGSMRGKTRAEKDKEVAEFLNRHGVNRDAKTAGTKWDNMLGEFRKVYEWERSEKMGFKSYFRLSPYERKHYRLPASFDEEVFEELAKFMGPRMRPSTSTTIRSAADVEARPAIATPSPSRGDDVNFAFPRVTYPQHKLRQLTSGNPAVLSGLDQPSAGEPLLPSSSSSSAGGFRGLRRIGKARMVWEESVSLWAAEDGGDTHAGRVRVQGLSFLNSDELTFLDETMAACALEAFEEGPLKGFSVDRFVCGQQVRVLGRRKSTLSSSPGLAERAAHLPLPEPFPRSMPAWEFQDPTEHYISCLRVPQTTLPSLLELSWHLQELPPEQLRFPLRRDVYKDLPSGRELFFTASSELLDCRAITYDILGPIIRSSPSCAAVSSRESLVGLWDDCVNRVVARFCPVDITFVRKPPSRGSGQNEWPNLTGFVRGFCLWRGEETYRLMEGVNQMEPSSSLVEKTAWSYDGLPYILGYHAVGHTITFCALSPSSKNRIIRTDLYSFNAASASERIKALVPCYRIAGLLSLLADRCSTSSCGPLSFKLPCYSDFARTDDCGGRILVEMTPTTVTKFYRSKREWSAAKEIYDFLDYRVPHAEYVVGDLADELGLAFKPRGWRVMPSSAEQLVEALKYVTKALVALHDLSFMHRDLGWDKVVRCAEEWVLCGFEEAVCAPQINSHVTLSSAAAAVEEEGRQAPEMGRGLHGVKVDVWGIGYLVKTCGLAELPLVLRELQHRCSEHNPELRPTAAECYHHLLQLQSSAGAGDPYP